MLKSPDDDDDNEPLLKKRRNDEDIKTDDYKDEDSDADTVIDDIEDIDESIKDENDYGDEDTDIDDAEDIDESVKDENEYKDDNEYNDEYKDEYKGENSSFYPLVLAVTCHGHITLDRSDKYEVTEIPDGMELIKISIATSGLINCCQTSSVSRYLVEINKSMSGLLSESLNDNILNNLLGRIRSSILEKAIPMSEKILGQKRKKDIEHTLYTEHLKCYDQGFKIHKLVSGNIIANKTYLRRAGEKNKNDFSLPEMREPIDIIKINSTTYSIPKIYDLFSHFFPGSYDSDFIQSVTLKQILQYYNDLGVTRLILFDFSCSIFKSDSHLEGYTPSGMHLRLIRQKNKDIPSGGKKSCKRKKYKKSCKNKKYKYKYKNKSCKNKKYKKSCKKKNNKSCKKM
jgi:hypothetical protein